MIKFESLKMGGKVPVSEAVIAMISMTIVLVIVLIIFCFVPAYKVWKKRREQLANFWETDPRSVKTKK